MEIFDEYIAPNIFLYSGLFQDYNQATLYKKKLEIIFKNTLVVRKKIPHKIKKKQKGTPLFKVVCEINFRTWLKNQNFQNI